MSDDSGLEEFMSKVGEGRDDEPSGGATLTRAPDGDNDTEKYMNENEVSGKLSQWSRWGTGFAATPDTIKRLPNGSYRPVFINDRLTLEPAQIVTDSLINFPDTRSDMVIAEIEQFWGLKDKFSQYGFSHKRGFLLWGPPGSGKTCTIAIIMKKMVDRGGLVIVADHPGALSQILRQLRSVEPERQLVVVWEDIDAVISRYGESEVLAVLDGESQVDNVVFIATTNYPEELDQRITNRPSRFDRIEKIDMPGDEARSIFLQQKTGSTVSPDGVDLVAESKGFSIAHLRELIVGIYCLGNPAKDVLKRLKFMKQKPKSDESAQKFGFGSED
jgi:hypothetical protein